MLGVNRAAYYAWHTAQPGPRQREDAELIPRIVAIFVRHKRRYGARRIADELADQEIVCSPRRVARILKSQGLRAIQPKSFVPKTTDSRHGLGYSPNLLQDMSTPTTPNRVWVGDITFLPLAGGGFAYLAGLMDLCTRDIVGWSVAATMEEPLVLAALRMAIRNVQPPVQLIHHTDRGGQYAGGEYRSVLRRAKMRQSMSRSGNCYDNAFMESCWGTFKTEMEMDEYKSMEAAKRAVAEYIHYYRFDRKHSSLGYLTPNQFARTFPTTLVS